MRSLLDLFRKPPRATEGPLAPLQIEIGNRPIAIKLKRSARARRLTLRLDRDGEGAIITLPNRVSRAEAQRFALKSSGWIEKQLANSPAKTKITDGGIIHLRGEPLNVSFTGRARGVVLHDVAAHTLHVPGLEAHAGRRLFEWLKSQAHHDLAAASAKYARTMETRIASVTVRDQKSRWGSCTSSGALSYSWRLILAPTYVLDYVAAHEVAHCLEMNHGPKFWRLVLTHCPHTRKAKDWLKKHGKDLHGIG